MKVEIIPPRGSFGVPLYRLTEGITIGKYHVPEGFITDGASLPAFARRWFSPMGAWAPAAVLHDYLLHIGTPRDVAAHEFREEMKDLGVAPTVRQVFYWAVRTWDMVHAIKK